jgi:hypothetical protein
MRLPRIGQQTSSLGDSGKSVLFYTFSRRVTWDTSDQGYELIGMTLTQLGDWYGLRNSRFVESRAPASDGPRQELFVNMLRLFPSRGIKPSGCLR